MRTVTYIGPFDEVEISTGQVLKKGEAVEIDDNELGDSLLEQSDNFAGPSAAKKEK